MPIGALTPLGRQLRSVLAGLSRDTTSRSSSSSARPNHATIPKQVAAPAIPEEHLRRKQEDGHQHTTRGSSMSRRRIDKLGKALRYSGAESTAAYRPPSHKFDISHVDVKTKIDRQAKSAKKKLHSSKERSQRRLTAILARYIRHVARNANTGEAEWESSFQLSQIEEAALTGPGYRLNDLKVWASAITAPDSVDTATILERHVAEHGWRSVPFVIHQYLLRRPYVKPAALSVTMKLLRQHLDALHNSDAPTSLESMLFITFIRLLRHAREVWPDCIDTLAEMLVSHFKAAHGGNSLNQMRQKTLMMNKAMELMSLPTAVFPFKDTASQESAVFRVLRYMVEHEPAILLTRSGYRAVVRIQLSQKKTSQEKQWAELKALSWPPWKVDRTSMDEMIKPEHGISRAGHTLARMREAGYAPHAWEKAALVQTGWDLDGTPSIQTRAFPESTLGSNHDMEGLVWAARIRSTRTAQEAWAAYLAYENTKEPASQSVFLAVFEKLYAEERRKRRDEIEDEDSQERDDRFLPGDTKEICPLPPSTHLYTYTPTPPPTVDGLFNDLRARDIEISGHCLAFIISNAETLQLGFRYIRHGCKSHPQLRALLSLDTSKDLKKVPEIVFAAIMQLLSRYTNVTLSKFSLQDSAIPIRVTNKALSTLDDKSLNPYHTLAYAIKMLHIRKSTFRPAYNTVLAALGRENTHASMRYLYSYRHGSEERHRSSTPPPENLELGTHRAALTSYRLALRILELLHSVQVELDAPGLYYFCRAVESAGFACWGMLKVKADLDESSASCGASTSQETPDILSRSTTSPSRRLTTLFSKLVGDDVVHAKIAAPFEPVPMSEKGKTFSYAPTPISPPSRSSTQLLLTPSPWLLHAYVRALGWLGDYDGILALVRWMAHHANTLREQRVRDHNGEILMRRTIVAVRVMLERSFLPESAKVDRDPRSLLSLFLEAPAEREVVEEVRELVESIFEWGGWPDEGEIEDYVGRWRFGRLRGLYGRRAGGVEG